jgi:hypothetical protein
VTLDDVLPSVVAAVGARATQPPAARASAPSGSGPLQLAIGNTTAWANGRPVAMDGAAQSVGGRTLVPIRFIATGGPPVVTGGSPGCGPDAGGQTVKLGGTDLAGASGLQFGDFGQAKIVQAAADGTWLHAVTPEACWGDSPVHVQVTTPAGTSASQHTYQAEQP